MATNIEQFVISAAEYFFWAKKSGNYPYGATGSITAGSDASMARHLGVASFTANIPEAPSFSVQGDGGSLGTIRGKATEPVTGTIVFNVMDLNFDTVAEGRAIYADGEFDATIMSQSCIDYASLAMVINFRTMSQATGSVGTNEWGVLELFDVEAQAPLFGLSGTSADAQGLTYNLSFDQVDTELNGLSFANGTNYSVKKGWSRFYYSPYPVCYHTHIGNAADVTLTLDYTPVANSTAKVKAWKDGVVMTYTTDYSTVGTAFTFAVAPASSAITVIRYQFTPDC